MRSVATQLEDADVVLNHIRARLADVAALDGRHKPFDSLRELKDAIAYHYHLGAILDNLRERFFESCHAAIQTPQPQPRKLEIVR